MELAQGGLRFFECFLRLLGVDVREQFALLQLKFGLTQAAFRQFDLSFVLRASGNFFCLLLDHLITQLLIFRLFIYELANLRLPVEFGQHVS